MALAQLAQVTVAVVALLATLGCAADTIDAADAAGAPARATLLDERFEGRALGSTWGTCHWWAPDGCTILTNDELEWYLPDQVEVADGRLRLTAEPGSIDADGRSFPYVSGMVSSESRFAFTYGRVEVRFRIPRGAGTWPAIWMLPASREALPEIDLLEARGQTPDEASVTLHPARGAGERRRREVPTEDLSVGWHTVTLDWAPRRLTWAIDGVEHMEVTGDAVPSEPMYLVANLAVGGDAGAPTAETPFPATFLIDRITVQDRP